MHVSVRRAGLTAFLVGVAFAAASTSLLAQATQGKLEGHVRDAESGAPLAGAQITVVGTTLGNIANAEGYYFVNNVPAGVHDIRAQFIGYGTVTVTGQRVLAGQSAIVDFGLSQQAVQIEGITVQGETNPLVPRDQTLSKAIITSEVFDAVPLDNVRAVIALQPGVVDTGSRLGQVIRGGRPGEAAVFIDGVLVRNFNAGSQSEITLQTNAVEEADVLLGGFGAEFGQAQSGVINLISKGGGTAFSGSIALETDQVEIENSYGYTRLEASVAGPIFGEYLGFSLSGVAVGQEDARPTRLGDSPGTLTFADFDNLTIGAQPDRFFAPTGTQTTLDDGTIVNNFAEICSNGTPSGASCSGDDIGAKLPWNNGDEYNLNLTLRGGTGAGTRYNAGVTLARNQRRFFSPRYAFRPQAMLGRRDKSYLIRGGIEHLLFQTSESSATLRVNVGYGEDEFMRGMLGETLADTLAIIQGEKFEQGGDFFGFTFDDFTFPFEDSFTTDAWFERFDEIQENPSLGFLTPFETIVNPATGENFTLEEGALFQTAGGGADNPFGINDFFGQGFSPFGLRREQTLSVRADLDWQYNRHNRVGIGGEVYWKDIENIGSGSSFGTAQSGVSNTSPTFQNVYAASPVIAGFYAKDRIDIGDIVLEIGGRVDMFDSDVVYPAIPGFTIAAQDPELGLVEPEFIEQATVWQFSPRLGVGFPVTENTQFRLSYGHFTQAPPLNFLFGGITNDLSKTNPNNIFGRPIEFGRTIGYEFGFTHSFDPLTVVDISGYTREKQGDIAFRQAQLVIPGQGGAKTVAFLTNGDFGYVRGMDARLSRRWTDLLFAQVNYSFLTTRTTGSDPTNFLRTIGRQANPVTGQPFVPPQAALPADFDRTHTFTGSLVMTMPDDFLEERSGLNKVLRNVTLNGALSARSGLPYTSSTTPGATASILGPDPVFNEEVNGSRLPWTFLLNASVGKAFELPRDMRVRAYVDVRNIANFKNPNDVWSLTGDVLNPGANFLSNRTSGTQRVFGEEVAYTDPTATLLGSALTDLQREQLRRRDVFFGNGDGVLSVDEQQLSSALSFLNSGTDANQTNIVYGQQFGQPRQIRLGLEWEF
ncbi:MAG: TonB-dependent receptor [Gemmatimonadota bacterium]